MRTSRLLVIKLCEEMFGIDMADIHGIVSYREPTAIPGSPDYVDGIIAIKGNIIVVISLKKIFNIEDSIIPENSQIIVINSEVIKLGFIVDEVSKAYSPDINEFERTPGISIKLNIKYIKCIKKYKRRSIGILNLESIAREIEF